MAPMEPHTKLIAAAAKNHLAAIGLRQRGRSRTWLDDRGWWVGIVEFQPSSWSKGSYVNVGGMWLWDELRTDLRFEFGPYRLGDGFVAYETDEQFEPLAEELAADAAAEVRKLRASVPDLPGAVALLQEQVAANAGNLWPDFDLGIALGLSGMPDEAVRTLESFQAPVDPADWMLDVVGRARTLAALIRQGGSAFRSSIAETVASRREALKLSNLAQPFG